MRLGVSRLGPAQGAWHVLAHRAFFVSPLCVAAGHGESGGFCKPGSNNYSESRVFRPSISKLYVLSGSAAATSIVAQLSMPARASQTYGSWASIYVQIQVDPHSLGLGCGIRGVRE